MKTTTQNMFNQLVDDLDNQKLEIQRVEDSFNNGLLLPFQYAFLMHKLGQDELVTDTEAIKYFHSPCSVKVPNFKIESIR